MTEGHDAPDNGAELVIPLDRLPPGFAESVESASAAGAPEPRPSATAVLLRQGDDGAELLFLKRLRTAGFVPGAYVFPGGRVDPADADAALVTHAVKVPAVADPPLNYWFGVLREVFEETGVLLARDADGQWCGDASSDARVAEWRERLLADGATMLDVLRGLQARVDFADVVPCAHWITPVAEPKRYDTRFFLAVLPPGRVATADAREMSDAVWLTPAAALERFRQGTLPMVFPTVKTVERLSRYRSVDEMLDAFRGTYVPPILPRLVRTAGGIGIVVDEERS